MSIIIIIIITVTVIMCIAQNNIKHLSLFYCGRKLLTGIEYIFFYFKTAAVTAE